MGAGAIAEVIAGYAADAEGLVARFETIEPAMLYAPVADLLPAPAASIVDIGAGTGRDAAWLAGRGVSVNGGRASDGAPSGRASITPCPRHHLA